MSGLRRQNFLWLLGVVCLALLLASLSTGEYVQARGMAYFELGGSQMARYQAVLDGHAGNPWQYRVLAPYLLSLIFKVFSYFQWEGHTAAILIGFRMMQDSVVLLLAGFYYHKLGLSWRFAALGLMLLAWSMSYSHYDSDMQFNTFFDVVFYLLAGLAILHQRFMWIIPITLVAAFNRETSGLIPFLLLASVFFSETNKSLSNKMLRRVGLIFAVSLVAYGVVFVGLRQAFGEQMLLLPYGHQLGWDLFQYNVGRMVTWHQLMATLGVLPLLALGGYHAACTPLRVFFWVMVPLWFVIHLFGAVTAETRLFLVPQALVFIPCALLFVRGKQITTL